MVRRQTTFYINDEIFQKFKAKCKSQGRTMSNVCEELIGYWINADLDVVDTVTDTLTVDLNAKEEKSWIRRKLNL